MSAVVVTSVGYDAATDVLLVTCDFSALSVTPAVIPVALYPDALADRMVHDALPDPGSALNAVVLEQAARLAPGVTGVTIDWQPPSGAQKTAELGALANLIAAARTVFAAG